MNPDGYHISHLKNGYGNYVFRYKILLILCTLLWCHDVMSNIYVGWGLGYFFSLMGKVIIVFLRFARKNLRPLSAMTNLTEEQSVRCKETGKGNTRAPGSVLGDWVDDISRWLPGGWSQQELSLGLGSRWGNIIAAVLPFQVKTPRGKIFPAEIKRSLAIFLQRTKT